MNEKIEQARKNLYKGSAPKSNSQEKPNGTAPADPEVYTAWLKTICVALNKIERRNRI